MAGICSLLQQKGTEHRIIHCSIELSRVCVTYRQAELAVSTITSLISVGPTLIYFRQFSHAYALIRVPTFINFWSHALTHPPKFEGSLED